MSRINASVSFSAQIEAPFESIKSAIANPDWGKWVPFLKSSVCQGELAGSTRQCTLASPDPQMDGYVLEETITENDRDAGRFAYSIHNPPMPVENLHGVVEANLEEDGAVMVTWTSFFEAETDVLDEVRPLTVQMYRVGLQGLETYTQQQTTAV